jgi:hypothetical protein
MPRTTSAKWLAAISITVGLLAVASLVITLATSANDPELLPEDTAEGAVQRYLIAWDGGDLEVAYGFLGEALADACSLPEFRRLRPNFRDSDNRVLLSETREVDGFTEVIVDVTEFYGSPPFETSEHTSSHRYLLDQTEDGWRFVESPWPYYPCPNIPKPPLPTATPTPTAQLDQEG